MKEIKNLIHQKNWDSLILKYSPSDICFLLNFSETMWLTKHLFFDDFCNDDRQQFALKLIFKIKNYFKKEWEADWKNDIFLGGLCSFLWLYDEQYDCYKRAYDKLADPPAALLLLLAGCLSAPGVPPITEEESESYLRRSAEKKITFETALMMRSLYESRGDVSQADYWDQIYKKLQKEGVVSDQLVPDVFTTSDGLD